MSADLDGRIGDGYAGTVPNDSHINVVIARRGTPTAAAHALALASPRPGHVPFLACLGPGRPVRPATIVVNKSTIDGERLGAITWGAAQLGIAQGVLDAVASGLLAAEEAGELSLLAALWVTPTADDETAVRRAAREAMTRAIANALASADGAGALLELVADRESAGNGFYHGE